MKSDPTLDVFMRVLPKGASVLDIGCGEHQHYADQMRQRGFNVTTIDRNHKADIQDIYPSRFIETEYDGIWCSHVLEHQVDVQHFLEEVGVDLKEGGWLAVTVPPRKDEIVGGHVSLWNAGLLLYRLILAGFDCKSAQVATYGYNVSVVVKYTPIDKLPPLRYDSGDIDTLKPYFPTGLDIRQGFNGVIEKHNWS